jgi:hypothetical protein
MSIPKRYQFDNHLPANREPAAVPAQRPVPVVEQQQVPQIVHIHQAAPDRTLQRVALGAGLGAGAVAAGVYFGPLLIAAFTSIAITLLVLALAVAVLTWGIVTVVRAVGGAGGKTGRR